MAAETKRPAKVPVALPRSESDSTPTTIPRDAVYKAVIGARIRVTISSPEPSVVEGTVFTSDPISNFLVLHTDPPSASPNNTHNSTNDGSPLPFQPGTYRFIQISNITNFQVLSLTSSERQKPNATLDPTTLDLPNLNHRLHSTLNTLRKAQSRLGPSGTTPQSQALFDSLARLYPMISWQSSTGAMVFGDDYVIEKPYGVENVRAVQGGSGSTAGLERVKNVVKMEKAKVELRLGAKEAETKSSKGAVGPAGGSPRKGG